MMIPEPIRDRIRDRLWGIADEIGWSALSDAERARYYEMWTRDSDIGGQLGHFMDPRKVRVYIKDSLVKPYERNRLSLNEQDVWCSLSVQGPLAIAQRFIKPHGLRLDDGRVVCWGKSRDWKLILMAVFERGRGYGARAFGAVLLESGKTSEESQRDLVREAAHRLGIEKLLWLE
jgi:hypothetical protein